MSRLWFAILLLVPAILYAQSLPVPPYESGKRVYRIPYNFIPEKLSTRGLDELNKEAVGLHYPFYIIFIQKLPTVTGTSTEDDTERAILALADGWSRDAAFDRNRSTLFLVSYGPGDRKYKMLPAPLWRSELGLEYKALDPFNNIFRSTARQDPQSALSRTMSAFDTYVYDRFDPARKAEVAKELRKQEEARRLETARLNLENSIQRLTSAADQARYHLKEDPAQYDALIREAHSVETVGDVEVLESYRRRIEQEAAPIEARVDAEIARIADETLQRNLIIAAIFIGSGLALVFYFVRRSALFHDRKILTERLDHWRGWITQARNRYYIFDENRERAPHLRAFGGRTQEIYRATSQEIDSIISGVEAIRERLHEIEGMAAKASILNHKPLNRAIAALDEPFDFNTEEISDKLFEPEHRVIRVTPSDFFKTLSERYDAAILSWQSLNQAVTLSMELPEKLFPHSGLDSLLARCQEHGIPQRWIRTHPLMGDDEADRDLYDDVDACRLTDPAAYSMRIEELRECEARLALDLERLVAALALAAEERIEKVEGLEQTILQPEDNPRLTLDSALAEHARLPQLFSDAESVDEVEGQAQQVRDLYVKAREQGEAARHAIQHASDEIDRAAAALAEAEQQEGLAARQLALAATEHRNVSHVERAVAAGGEFLTAGRGDLDKARRRLGERRHLESYRAAGRAESQVRTAVEKYRLALGYCADLDAAKAKYERQLRQMEAEQASVIRRIRRYGGSADTIDVWRTPRHAPGPLDYAYLFGVLQSQQQQWNMVARQAQVAYEQEQAAIRAAQEARRQDSWGSSSSSGSFGGGFSGGSSGSSGESFGGGGSGSSGGSW